MKKAEKTGKVKVAAENRGPSALDLAYDVLKEAGKPMNQGELAKAVLAKGWKTSGKTPGATIYSGIINEMRRKGKDSRFARAADVRGAFVVLNVAA